jgi:hypothetical protein
MSVSCCLGGQGRSPKLDSLCKSSSKHKVTEEVNFQFARRISHVATTAIDVTYYENGGILLTVMRRLMKA